METRFRQRTVKPNARTEGSFPRTRKTDLSQTARSPIDHIMNLHKTIGNRAVRRLIKDVGSLSEGGGRIRAKLKIGRPNDIYEREADRVADQVTRMPESPPRNVCARAGEWPNRFAKQPSKMETHSIHRSPFQLNRERIQSLRGRGHSLPKQTRQFFESRMGYKFGNVRIHTGSSAAKAAEAVNAKAFALGNNIIFNEGEYSPYSQKGKKLLAHELTHVIQQSAPSKNSLSIQYGYIQRWAKYCPTVSSRRSLSSLDDFVKRITERDLPENEKWLGLRRRPPHVLQDRFYGRKLNGLCGLGRHKLGLRALPVIIGVADGSIYVGGTMYGVSLLSKERQRNLKVIAIGILGEIGRRVGG